MAGQVGISPLQDVEKQSASVSSISKKPSRHISLRNLQVCPAAKFDVIGTRKDNDSKATLQNQVFSWMNWSPPPGTPCYHTLHKYFPGAIPGKAVHFRTRRVLCDPGTFGLTPANTIFGTSICPDEINNEEGDLADILNNFWGECFPFGGIGGAPFVGKTGFKAFSHHVPDDGNLFILFGPHVAISTKGEVGKYLREGQHEHSSACGAVIGAYNHCCGKYSDPWFFDEFDLQMEWIKTQISPHVELIQQQENPMAALTYQAFESVKQKILRCVDTDFGPGKLVLLGGIQINMPKPLDDHFMPLFFEVHQSQKENINLMSAFEAFGDDMAQSSKDRDIQQTHIFSWLDWAPDCETSCFKTLHACFPGAIPGQALIARISSVLEPQYGLTPENTILGTSLCPDEINNLKGHLVDSMKKYWGELFPMGGISGTPFVGKTGFKAFSHHVPDQGNVLVLYGPHVAISSDGQVGKYHRQGQREHSTACGAVIGAYCACCKQEFDGTQSSAFDEADVQMEWIKAELAPHIARIEASENPLAALTFQAYEMVKAHMLGIVDNDFGEGCLVLVGGIQINMPLPYDDHFLPLMFEVRRKGKLPRDHMDAFEWTTVDHYGPDDYQEMRHNDVRRRFMFSDLWPWCGQRLCGCRRKLHKD